MNGSLQYREATMLDVATVLDNLRTVDRHEIEAAGYNPDAIFEALCAGTSRMIAVLDYRGNSIGIAGASPEPGMEGAARVWLLTHCEADVSPRVYLRDAPGVLNWLGEGFDVLFNLKWVGNEDHLPWLRRLGFSPLRKLRLPTGHHFYEIVRMNT